jgi:hypothetical protein
MAGPPHARARALELPLRLSPSGLVESVAVSAADSPRQIQFGLRLNF